MSDGCQYNGNVKDGKVVPCKEAASVVLRHAGLWALYFGKVRVCQDHGDELLSAKTKACGRDWQIDHFVRDEKAMAP